MPLHAREARKTNSVSGSPCRYCTVTLLPNDLKSFALHCSWYWVRHRDVCLHVLFKLCIRSKPTTSWGDFHFGEGWAHLGEKSGGDKGVRLSRTRQEVRWEGCLRGAKFIPRSKAITKRLVGLLSLPNSVAFVYITSRCLPTPVLETLLSSAASLSYRCIPFLCCYMLGYANFLHVQVLNLCDIFVGSSNKGPASKRRRTSSRSQDEDFIITVSVIMKLFTKVIDVVLEQGRCSGDSTCLPPMCCGLDYGQCLMYVEFVVGSRFVPKVFLRVPWFSLLH